MVRLATLAWLICFINYANASSVQDQNNTCQDTLFMTNGDTRVITFLYETSTTIVFNICDGETNAKSEVRKKRVESISFENGKKELYKGYYLKHPDIKKPKTAAQNVGLVLLVLLGIAALVIGGFLILIYNAF